MKGFKSESETNVVFSRKAKEMLTKYKNNSEVKNKSEICLI
jgi:hypothetical protein